MFDKKLIFIHIPKTAGSTINKILQNKLGDGKDHIEAWLGSDKIDKARDLNWISGHVPRWKMVEYFGNGNIYFTFVREPHRQLISHLKWQFLVVEKGVRFFKSHPRRNQEIILDVINTDFSDIKQVIDMLYRNKALFLNFQSKYLYSKDNPKLDEDFINNDLKFFKLIGDTRNVVSDMSKLLNQEIENTKINVNSLCFFDESVFASTEIQDFLMEHHARDIFSFNNIHKNFF